MLNTHDIINAAKEKAGIDLPIDKPTFEGLSRYVDALNAEAPLTEMGWQSTKRSAIDTLANRLRVEDYLTKHPELLERPVDKPLFVFGLPRTGTTLVINLLNADPARRCFLRWESLNSVPPPKVAELSTDPRCLQSQQETEMSLKFAPQIAAIHYEDADSPTECQFSMSQTFCAQVLEAMVEIPSYRSWFLHEADYLPVFKYHKRLLQLLQAEAPGRWTLKNPWHPLFLNELTTVYPDAQRVMTHRDPADVVGSCCSLIKHVRAMFSDQVNLDYIGSAMVETFQEMVKRTIAFKEQHGWDSIYDLQYADVMKDPIGEIRKLYGHFDETFTAEAEAAMNDMLSNNPKGKFGKHEYTLEEYGLDREMIHERFGEYCERFNIPTKD